MEDGMVGGLQSILLDVMLGRSEVASKRGIERTTADKVGQNAGRQGALLP